MPRLIRIDETKEKEVTHSCGAVVGYYSNDIKKKTISDYTGSSEQIKYIVCPNCGENILV